MKRSPTTISLIAACVSLSGCSFKDSAQQTATKQARLDTQLQSLTAHSICTNYKIEQDIQVHDLSGKVIEKQCPGTKPDGSSNNDTEAMMIRVFVGNDEGRVLVKWDKEKKRPIMKQGFYGPLKSQL